MEDKKGIRPGQPANVTVQRCHLCPQEAGMPSLQLVTVTSMNAMVSVGPKKELGQDGYLLLLPRISFVPSRGSDIITMVKK